MKLPLRQNVAGYTMIELIVIVVIVGILAAIAGPSWLGLLNRQRINVAQAEAASAIREAQSRAKQQKRAWEVCFQDDGTKVRWFVRPVPSDTTQTCASNPQGPWNNLAGSDADKVTINQSFSSPPVSGFYNVRFRENGWVNASQPNSNSEDIAKITFVTKPVSSRPSKRCVAVATLLGAVRTANDDDCNNKINKLEKMQLNHKNTDDGYTLLEILIIVVIVGILSAIAAPSWLAFLNRQRLNVAQAEALSIMRDAQANAKRQKSVWEACFRQNQTDKKVQWSVHPVKNGGSICENARWQNVIGSDTDKISIDISGDSRSTLFNRNNIYRVQFNHKGWVNGQLGKITFTNQNPTNISPRRCVYVSTLLGAMRTDRDRGCGD